MLEKHVKVQLPLSSAKSIFTIANPHLMFIITLCLPFLLIQLLAQRRDPRPQRIEFKLQIRPTEHDLAEKCLRAIDAAIPGAGVEEAGTGHSLAVNVHVWRDGDVLLAREFVNLF